MVCDLAFESTKGNKIVPSDTVCSSINNILYSAFSEVKVLYNDSLIVSLSHYNYLAYLSVLWNCNTNSMNTFLKTQGFEMDKYDEYNKLGKRIFNYMYTYLIE